MIPARQHWLPTLQPRAKRQAALTLLAILILPLLLAGCSGNCKGEAEIIGQRSQWPTLLPYPGAEVRQQITSPPSLQLIRFATTATREQVMQYYRTLLEPQGWTYSTTGNLIDYRTCPKLSLKLTTEGQDMAGTLFHVEFELYACRDYC